MGKQDFVLYFGGMQAQCGPILSVAETICEDYHFQGHIIVPETIFVPASYDKNGMIPVEDFFPSSTSLKVHKLKIDRCGGTNPFSNFSCLKAILKGIKPSYFWLHTEYWERISTQVLWYYRLRSRPRIIAYAATNNAKKLKVVSTKWRFIRFTRFMQILLWPRLNGIAACASKSMQNARLIGVPETVPIVVNYLPVYGTDGCKKKDLTFSEKNKHAYTIGFSGTISKQKGWKILLRAMEKLPENYKIVIAGDGDQKKELIQWIKKSDIKGRADYRGFLPHDRMLATMRSFDVLVLPSLTMAPSPEQFGCVLAEAMARGVPVIGSDSGAIPETVGDAGLIVAEGDADALVKGISRITNDDALRERLISRGLERYKKKFSCEAYARSIVNLLGIAK